MSRGTLPALRIIKEVHGQILAEEEERPLRNRLLRRVLKNRRLFHFLLRRAPPWPAAFCPERIYPPSPLFLRQRTRLPQPANGGRHSLAGPLAAVAARRCSSWTRVALFGGCLVDFVYPEQGEALVKLLRDRQVRVDYPVEQTCCGLPAKCMGELDLAREVALQNLWDRRITIRS